MRRGARRERRGSSGSVLTISVTPLIDAVFLLLIYFMLVGEFRQDERATPTSLAPADSEQTGDPFALPETPITLRVRSLGSGEDQYIVRGAAPLPERTMSADAFARALVGATDAIGAEQLFEVRPDASALWEHTVLLVTTLTDAGYSRVSLQRIEEGG